MPTPNSSCAQSPLDTSASFRDPKIISCLEEADRVINILTASGTEEIGKDVVANELPKEQPPFLGIRFTITKMFSTGNRFIQSTLRYSHSNLVMPRLSLKVSQRYPTSLVQNSQHRFTSGDSSPHNQPTRIPQTNSMRTKPFGEIAVKKRSRATEAENAPPGEKLKAILGNDGDRRVWISISGEEPTDEDLAQAWPKRKQKRVVRQLEVSDDGCVDEDGHYERAVIYKVAEKTGTGGRRFWREVCSFDWDEWMAEEGFDLEIARQMEKTL